MRAAVKKILIFCFSVFSAWCFFLSLLWHHDYFVMTRADREHRVYYFFHPWETKGLNHLDVGDYEEVCPAGYCMSSAAGGDEVCSACQEKDPEIKKQDPAIEKPSAVEAQQKT